MISDEAIVHPPHDDAVALLVEPAPLAKHIGLEAVLCAEQQPVAEEVEAELFRGAISDRGGIALASAALVIWRLDDADGNADSVEEWSHPFGVAFGEVIVHRRQVRPFAR
jgi:hypothetical protein